MRDEELERAYKEQFARYCSRMAYFQQLPDAFSSVPLMELREAPEAHGVTRSEYEQYLRDKLQHFVEGCKLERTAEERRRRIRRTAATEASEAKDLRKALADELAMRFDRVLHDGGDLVHYLERREAAADMLAEHNGRLDGLLSDSTWSRIFGGGGLAR